MKKVYSNNNPFAGKKVLNFKREIMYPKTGETRFIINLDKNGQICEIRKSTAHHIEDTETGEIKRIYNVTRPKKLYTRVYGRPLELAIIWIDEYISQAVTENE